MASSSDAIAVAYRADRFRRAREITESFGGPWDERKHPRRPNGEFAARVGAAFGDAKAGVGEAGRRYLAARKKTLRNPRNRAGAASAVLSGLGGSLGAVGGTAVGLAATGGLGSVAGGLYGGGVGYKAGEKLGRRLDKHLPALTQGEAAVLSTALGLGSLAGISRSGGSQRLFMRALKARKHAGRKAEAAAVAAGKRVLGTARAGRMAHKLRPWIEASDAVAKDFRTMGRAGYRFQKHPIRSTRRGVRSAYRVARRIGRKIVS